MTPEREREIREWLGRTVGVPTLTILELQVVTAASDALAALDAERAAHTETKRKASDTEGDLASACDLANSWAREMGVAEASRPAVTREVIDRLWSHASTTIFQQAAQIAALRGALEPVARAYDACATTAVFDNCYVYGKAQGVDLELFLAAKKALALPASELAAQVRQVVEALRFCIQDQDCGGADTCDCWVHKSWKALATPLARMVLGKEGV